MDVDQNPVPPVNLKVDGHPLYHMISRFWPIPILQNDDVPWIPWQTVTITFLDLFGMAWQVLPPPIEGINNFKP